ncbi:MAG: hypothetical protein GY849_20995, partial [Deltaproteobacteria bacterium]|nr:hypothetical protein [Deltaproteobacteria bacterium]
GQIDVGELVVEPTVLTAPEVTSYESADLFHPLELAIDEIFAVGHGCRVDLSERGLLGSTTEDSMVLPGEVGAEPWAGGSHGGLGWFGSPGGGWNHEDLNQPGSVYDSLRDPYLPGGGGGSPSNTVAGGTGGGVVRLDADGATVRLVGDVLAGGGSGHAGGGAGGAIRLVAGSLEGSGRIDAVGGPGSHWYRSGGGGGGRVSIAYRELGPEVDLAAQINVAGSHNHASDPTAAVRRGGAGTIYLEQLDPITGASGGVGRLVVANLSGLPAAFTPLPALDDGAVFSVDPIAATVTLDVNRVTGDLTGDRLVLEQATGAPVGGSPGGGIPITAQERLGPTEGFRIRLTVAATAAELEAVAALLDAGTPVVFHGRGRLSHIEAKGTAFFIAADDLELGPADDPAPVLNDRSRLYFDGEARGLLRGNGPLFTITATPPESSDVRVGSTIELAWVLNDPVGLSAAGEHWSLDAEPTVHTITDEPLEVTSGDEPLLLAIPVDALPGPVSYTLDAGDV